MLRVLLATASIVIASLSFAAPQNQPREQGEHHRACKEIKSACQSAGFILGEAAEGKGLWRDCVCPILTGGGQPKNAELRLPAVSSQVVQECRTHEPRLCSGQR